MLEIINIIGLDKFNELVDLGFDDYDFERILKQMNYKPEIPHRTDGPYRNNYWITKDAQYSDRVYPVARLVALDHY